MKDDEKKNDPVNHPSHYTAGKVECIDALEAATVGLTGIEAICTAACIKYLWRWKLKNGVEDLKKARWYLERLIQTVEKTQPAIGFIGWFGGNDGSTFPCTSCRKLVAVVNREGWCRECFDAPTKPTK